MQKGTIAMKKTPKVTGQGGHAHWPALEEQLKAANVTPGSALDTFIRAHQALEMLRPEETTDQLGLPPWIRVFWRKQHPDGKYFGPSGGYPLVLDRLLDWMIAHEDLPGFEPKTGGPHGN
jgi:hypothetical protein